MALGRVPEEENEGGIFAEINITPLTDIFLVLLIIFMVSASVMVDQANNALREGVKVNLPKGATKEIDQGANSLLVAINKEGRVIVAGQQVQDADLKSLFTSAVAKDAQTQVIIQADEGVTHGIVVHVMELAKDAGLVRLAIATRGGAK
jgi:biopolymer transport protein ExbD